MKRWLSNSYWDFDAGYNLHNWSLGPMVVWHKGGPCLFSFSLGPLFVEVDYWRMVLPPSKETR